MDCETSFSRTHHMARPREFDSDDALQASVNLFWEKGYHATSITDLTEAMGVLRGSLYKAFGDKHTLFIKSLKAYSENLLEGMRKNLETSKPVEALNRTLDIVVGTAHGKAARKGCMIANSALELVPEDPVTAVCVNKHYDAMESLLTRALEKARTDGKLKTEMSPTEAAQAILVWIQGTHTIGKTKTGKVRAANSLAQLKKTLNI